MSDRSAKMNFFISTNQQKVLAFLAKFSDQEYHEREIARKVGISYGSANSVLNELFNEGILVRRRVGKMLFYSFNSRDPIFKTFKIIVSIALIRPLIKKLKDVASEIVLYGSCARGEDTSRSDMDLFVVSEEKEEVLEIIDSFRFIKGFEHLKIEPAVLSPLELLKSEKDDKEFLSLVREGIVLWDEMTDEAGIPRMSEPRQNTSVSTRKSPRR
jgi:predicted nucleotidyltransferase